MIPQRCFAALVVLTLLFPSVSAAQLGVQIDATVGLDAPTRELIDRLPDKVHEQVINTLKEALPLLDTSVDKYLGKVNEILDHQLNHSQCAIAGVIGEADRRLKNLVSVRDKGPLELFDAFEKSELGRIRESTNAELYSKIYGDIFYEATITYCMMEISGSAINAEAAENKYRVLNFNWLRLKGSCGAASDCAAKLRKATERFLRESDARDVNGVQATPQLAKVADPDSGWHWWWSSFDPKPYDLAVGQLLDIQTQVQVSKAHRQSTATRDVAQALQNQVEFNKRIANAQSFAKPLPTFPCSHYVDQNHINLALAEVKAADDIYSQTKQELEEAIELDSAAQSQKATEIKSALEPMHSSVDAIRTLKPYVSAPDPGCKIHMN